MEKEENLKTPCYLFDEKECRERTRKTKHEISAFGGKICYAIKANPFLVPILINEVDKFEVCSPGELEICRHYQVPGEQILFSGVVKSKDDIKAALNYKVNVITLESLAQWETLKECLRSQKLCQGGKVKIMPRLSNGAQFGMEEEQIWKIFEEQKNIEEVQIEGLHYFTGTQKKGNKYEKEIECAIDFLQRLDNKYNLPDMVLEYGPGLAVPYFINDNFDDLYQGLYELKNYIIKKEYPFRIDIELGRYIAATCGKYMTDVVDVKKAENRKYCLVDGGIHHVNYYGSNMAMRTPIIQHLKKGGTSSKDMEEYIICGSLCTFADILARGIMLDHPEIGDRLIFENIGAYSVTEASYLFLSRDMPVIYLKNWNGTIRELRSSVHSFEINESER